MSSAASRQALSRGKAMSYERALKTIRREPVDHVGLVENLDHPAFMETLIGYDPWSNPLQAYVDSYKALDVDWVIGLPRRTVRFAPGQSSVHGADGTAYTEWGLSGSSWRESYLFHDEESVLRFDPLANVEGEELVTVAYNEEQLANRRADQALMGSSALVTGLYYTTLFQFGIMVFGWELFLTTAAGQPERFQPVLQGLAEVSRRNLAAWAADATDLIFIHDDIAMERGLVFHPEWYRKRLFPLYEYLLEPVQARPGLKSIFVSDGNYADVVDDLFALGFDGFLINSGMSLGAVAQRLGPRVFLAGNVSTPVLTVGTTADVRQEVRRCIEEARPAGGHFMHAGGDLPHNIPLDNIRAYFDAVAELGGRR